LNENFDRVYSAVNAQSQSGSGGATSESQVYTATLTQAQILGIFATPVPFADMPTPAADQYYECDLVKQIATAGSLYTINDGAIIFAYTNRTSFTESPADILAFHNATDTRMNLDLPINTMSNMTRYSSNAIGAGDIGRAAGKPMKLMGIPWGANPSVSDGTTSWTVSIRCHLETVPF
jgi:hypothetical protein